jgi:hypothetical protein
VLELGDAAVAAAQIAVNAPTEILPRFVPDVDPEAVTMIRPGVAPEAPADEAAAETLIHPAETLIHPAGDQLPPAKQRPPRRSRSRAVLAVAAVIVVGAAVGIGLAAGAGAGGETATVVAASGAHVRTGPDLGANVVASLAVHRAVTVSCWTKGSGTLAGGGWDRLQSPDAGQYVAADLLNPMITTPQC